jgi:hypothetical protein
VVIDAADEYERVRHKYPPMPARDLALYVAGLALLVVLSLFRDVDWFFFAGMAGAVIAWEVTKFRLRQNARHFLGSVQRG